ncbi:ReoY family proteolytic degradation factor [Planomicrobium sp. CPCC 101110]|uniref:ReoY family proteolytic degradation factor n=1 Tax=Planomicrobium sp. CPCC 101110 TaxID=2599619 RepID=UPI0011B7AA88|nr:ReoY family proteolytic degradation factor [Planomicrobium sp. CPCC 101110]TWT28320.1 IDEAL domain-containing protein [Planomicrobium sp. CPCC 101110]
MTASVSVGEKKQFVRWFLQSHKMKRRECIWILNYMLSNENLLEKTHFVEEAHYCPRAMVMSSTESKEIPFRFYKGNLMTADAEKSFHDLRLNPEEELYVQLNFPNRPPSPLYLSVLEENPYMPKNASYNVQDRLIAEKVLEESMSAFQEEAILKQIDEALDSNDRDKFFKLSELLQSIQTMNKTESE